MSLVRSRMHWGMIGFPRVSGDEPFASQLKPPSTLFSPRERG